MGDPTWHGYPQHPDVHPERPWWRLLLTAVGRTAVRIDGARVSFNRNLSQWKTGNPGYLVTTPTNGGVWQDEAPDLESLMIAYDAAHPLPCPPPMCGQVWVWEDISAAHTIIAARKGFGVLLAGIDEPVREWPLPDTVLVAGPGAPWAPMGGEDV